MLAVLVAGVAWIDLSCTGQSDDTHARRETSKRANLTFATNQITLGTNLTIDEAAGAEAPRRDTIPTSTNFNP
jgi:hypothetical protein